ncbi:MAG: hypothetical protein RL258_284 [Pseudomonadota bacterium]|jgi:CRP-like cAMP-binding protein
MYFPITAVVSLTVDHADGSGVDFALVGREGFVGFFRFLPKPVVLGSATVQCPGTLYRVQADIALAFFDRSVAFRRLLMEYMQTLVVEAAQNSSCYRHHSIEQQLCRSLLTYMDRQQSQQLHLTHEMLARSLGVRREGVTLAARRLSDLGMIRNTRGSIEILSPMGLKSRSCECYHVLMEMRHTSFVPPRSPFA